MHGRILALSTLLLAMARSHAQSPTGTIRGEVRWQGPPPKVEPLPYKGICPPNRRATQPECAGG